MDQEDFIKIQHESPIKASHNFASIYMNHFYDQDSYSDIDIIKKQDNQYSFSTHTDEIIERVEQVIDIRTTSIHTIVSYVKENFSLLDDMDWQQFERNLKKRKLLIKRNFAKNRDHRNKKEQIYVVCDNIEGIDIQQQLQAEIKKKRNRMSAQISRDRRKMKIQQLQANNKKLKAETEKMLQENEKLKKQLEEFNKVEEKKIEATKGKSKFLSILIMLGMFFLFTVIRDSFKSNQSSVKVSNKLTKQDNPVISAEQQAKIIEDGQRAFKEMENIDEPLFGSRKMLQNVIYKLQQLKLQTVDLQVSKSLKQQLDIIKRQVS